jgi:Tfp pilus assembly protein PilV
MPWRETSGLSLLELIVAVAVLNFAVLALAAVSLRLADHARSAEARTHLRLRAQARMERLLASRPERLAPGSSREGGAELIWDVDGTGLRTLRLVARQRLGPVTLTDTLVTVVSLP